MREFIGTDKQWAKIARKIPGRTQHQTKNRFFSLLMKELSLSKEKIKNYTKRNCLVEVSKWALAFLQAKQKKNMHNEEIIKKSLDFYNSSEENNSSEERKEMPNSELERKFDVEEFINFEKDEQIFVDFS